MIYPFEAIAPLPHPDLPDNDHHHDQTKDGCLEARAIVSQ